ncbi:MAG: two-component system response regulator [Paucimonas sp.]|nr:two-component system response regulator [Paucimonas sp.]
MHRVMLIEDDQKLASMIAEYLSAYEFEVEVVNRGDRAMTRFRSIAPDVVVLDLMLPGLDGMVVCKQLRESSKVPILILTARGDTADEIAGLEQGADDYLSKPIQPPVLLARLRALLRRGSQNVSLESGELVFGAFRLSKENRTAYWHDKQVPLNSSEYKLLSLLADSAGKVLSRDEVLRRMHGVEFDGLDRRIDIAVSRLRRKFDDHKAEKIKTVWGEGYLFSPAAWE